VLAESVADEGEATKGVGLDDMGGSLRGIADEGEGSWILVVPVPVQ